LKPDLDEQLMKLAGGFTEFLADLHVALELPTAPPTSAREPPDVFQTVEVPVTREDSHPPSAHYRLARPLDRLGAVRGRVDPVARSSAHHAPADSRLGPHGVGAVVMAIHGARLRRGGGCGLSVTLTGTNAGTVIVTLGFLSAHRRSCSPPAAVMHYLALDVVPRHQGPTERASL
jgi:hypothetical protein